jgi:hypothetical protein
MNRIQKRLFALLAFGSIASVPAQAAFMSIDDVVDVYLLGSIRGEYRTNIFNQENNEVDDTAIIVSPGVEVNVGRSSNARLNVRFREHITRYSDLSGLNFEGADLRATGNYQFNQASVFGNVGFRQVQQNIPGANAGNGDLVERDITTAGLGTKVDVTPKVYTTGAFDYAGTDYVGSFSNNLNDQKTYSLPLNVLYRITPKTAVGVGYRYRHTTFDASGANASPNDFDDHFFSLALRGEVPRLPKLSADINLGYQFRDSEGGGGNDDSITILSSLTWAATEKVSATGGYQRDFGGGPRGNSSISDTLLLSVDYAYNPKVSFTSGISYRMIDYQTGPAREDNNTVFNVGASYTPNDYLKFSAGYVFNWNDNEGAGTSYSGNTFNLTASVRY